MTVLLFKKGEQRVYSNDRGITPLSIPMKVYVGAGENSCFQEKQCGLLPGRGTLDQLFTYARILEGAWEPAQPLFMCFVDLKKAYNCIPHCVLWGALQGVWGIKPLVTGNFTSVQLA